MRIITPKALLRPWILDDADALTTYANNPAIAAMMRDGFPSPYTRGDAIRFITNAGNQQKNLFLAMESGGETIGGIGIHPLEDVYRRSAEIGYWLAEPFWGKGIATAAVRSLVPVAYEMFDIIRIQAGVFSNNPASMKVLEKSGFVREAVHKNAIYKNGNLLNEILYVHFRQDLEEF